MGKYLGHFFQGSRTKFVYEFRRISQNLESIIGPVSSTILDLGSTAMNFTMSAIAALTTKIGSFSTDIIRNVVLLFVEKVSYLIKQMVVYLEMAFSEVQGAINTAVDGAVGVFQTTSEKIKKPIQEVSKISTELYSVVANNIQPTLKQISNAIDNIESTLHL